MDDGGTQPQAFVWTDEALATLAQRRAAGESVAEIAAALGMT